MEKFIIKLSDGSRYLACPVVIEDVVAYMVIIGNQNIRFVGNPDWDRDGVLVIPDEVPDNLKLALVMEMAEQIENHFC